jgi:hypothetical protein
MASLLPGRLCHVAPQNDGLLTLFAQLLVVADLISLPTGRAYDRRVITQHEEPSNDWFAVGCLQFLALLNLGMLTACPHDSLEPLAFAWQRW